MKPDTFGPQSAEIEEVSEVRRQIVDIDFEEF